MKDGGLKRSLVCLQMGGYPGLSGEDPLRSSNRKTVHSCHGKKATYTMPSTHRCQCGDVTVARIGNL
jgi:hypothetical protein